MKRVVFGLGLFCVFLVGLIYFKFNGRLNVLTTSQIKEFKDLNEFEMNVVQYDSVYGDYLQWTGIQDLGPGNPESVARKLLFDKSNKFAIKAIIDDKSGFFSKIPGDINFSGQWRETNDKLTLQFYFPPTTWYELFDSVKNENTIEFVDKETITLDKDATTIWIMGTECKKVK